MIDTNSNRNWVRAALLIGLAVPLFAQGSQTLTVSAFMDIWQAGGYNDGAGAGAQPPASYPFTAGPGQALSFSKVTGTWSCGNGAVPNGPDGTNTGICFDTAVTVFNPIGPFSGLDMTDFSRPLVGMFLSDSLPTSALKSVRCSLLATVRRELAAAGFKYSMCRQQPRIFTLVTWILPVTTCPELTATTPAP